MLCRLVSFLAALVPDVNDFLKLGFYSHFLLWSQLWTMLHCHLEYQKKLSFIGSNLFNIHKHHSTPNIFATIPDAPVTAARHTPPITIAFARSRSNVYFQSSFFFCSSTTMRVSWFEIICRKLSVVSRSWSLIRWNSSKIFSSFIVCHLALLLT